MDAQDVLIIKGLGFRPYESADGRREVSGPWDIGKDLGMHGTTVKRRVEQMQSDGVLLGLHMLPHFSLLGIHDGLYLFTFADAASKRRGFKRMLEHQKPGGPFFTARIESFIGNQAMCVVACPTTLDIQEAVAAAADEFGASTWHLLETHDWTIGPANVRAVDRRILHAFYTDALKPIGDVAAAAGVTPKTVRARIKTLIQGRLIEVFPDVAPAFIKGLVPHLLLVDPKPGCAVQASTALANAFPAAFIRSRAHALVPYAYLAGEDTAELAKNVAAAQALPGVREARLLLFEESGGCPNHAGTPPLGAFLEESLEASARPYAAR